MTLVKLETFDASLFKATVSFLAQKCFVHILFRFFFNSVKYLKKYSKTCYIIIIPGPSNIQF